MNFLKLDQALRISELLKDFKGIKSLIEGRGALP